MISLVLLASANLVALGVHGVVLRNNMGADTMVLEGFTYSANDEEMYNVCIALLKDILDTESANALIKWVEELDRLNTKGLELAYNSKSDSAEYEATKNALKAHLAPLKEGYVDFGNVQASWKTEGNVKSIIIRNK